MSDSVNDDRNDDHSQNRSEEWVRERLVTRLYEPLSPEEESELEAYLEAHPELRDVEKQYREIASELRESTEEIADKPDDVLVLDLQRQIAGGGRSRGAKVLRWLAGTAVAASFVALIVSKGLVIQVGEARMEFGEVPKQSLLAELQLREEIMEEVVLTLRPYFYELQDQVEAQRNRMEVLVNLVAYQREVDRQQTRNTIRKLAQLTMSESKVRTEPFFAERAVETEGRQEK